MQDTITDQDSTTIDLSKVTALHQKRTLAFVNHFVISTVQFLNNFMKQCEQKLMMFERKLEKAEAAMILLETRLSSIPEITNITIQENKVEENSLEENLVTAPLTADSDQSKEEKITESIIEEVDSISPEYDRFIKMVQVGVPLDAVKLKASLEGLDPDILEKRIRK